MSPRELDPPAGTEAAGGQVLATSGKVEKQWKALLASHAANMVQCYEALRDEPFPKYGNERHHALKGKKFQQGKGEFWEYEVGGAERVRYKRGPKDVALVVFAGNPSDTH